MSLKNAKQIKQTLLKNQNSKCWHCGRPIDDDAHIHHGIIPKGHTLYSKYHTYLDMVENLALVCWKCDLQHGMMTGYLNRCKLWSQKIRQGYDMQNWLDNAPMYTKDKFIYLESNGKG